MEQTTSLNQCRNCGNEFAGKFCNQCGEKVFHTHQKSIKYIFEEFFHFLTHFEGSFFNTVRTIFRHPGKLSADYCSGIRKKYYKPTSLYLLVVIVYLLFPLFPGLNLSMKGYEGQGRFGVQATAVIREKMKEKKISYYQLADRFKNKSTITSKFILLLVLPLCSLGLMLLFINKKKVFFDHFIMSIEINTFFIAATFLLLPLLVIAIEILAPALTPYLGDDLFILIYIVLIPLFCTIAFRRFYSSKTALALIKSVGFMGIHFLVIFYVYRIISFYTIMALI